VVDQLIAETEEGVWTQARAEVVADRTPTRAVSELRAPLPEDAPPPP
jgi:hypothetical protein